MDKKDNTELKKSMNPKDRFRYGMIASLLGIFSNALLFAFKLALGIISSSITLIADAVNNISDAGSSIVTGIGFKVANKPADKNHPFGHERFEYVSALIVAIIVFALGFSLLISSIERAINPTTVTISIFVYIVLGVSIFIKLLQMVLYIVFSIKINSKALKAAATDSFMDSLITIVVLASYLIIDYTGLNIDAYMSIIVSLFIIITSLSLIKDTINPLLGMEPSPDLVKKIRNKILSYDGVIGMHDLCIHSYGLGTCFCIVHVELPSDKSLKESHKLIDTIEQDFMNEMNINLNIHIDPVDTKDQELKALKYKVTCLLLEFSRELSIHDFRIERDENIINIFFDVIIPYECKITIDEIKTYLEKEFLDENKTYKFFITVDKNAVL